MASPNGNVGAPEPPATASRPCPVCDGAAVEAIYRQRFAPFKAGSIADGYDVVACIACGMCYADGLPEEARFAEYYAHSSKYDLGGAAATLPPNDIARFFDQAAFLAASVPTAGLSLLDVGTATGGFLNALRDAGFGSLFGVDPSPDAVRVAREVNCHDVRVGGLDAARGWGQRFDLVTYVAVLEHVLDPRVQVRAVASLLAPGGYLFISVPDASSFADHALAPFQEFSVEHINFFTPASLDNALGLEGFEPVSARQVVLPLGSDGGGPAIEAIYRRTGSATAWTADLNGREALQAYVRASSEEEAGPLARIADLADAGTPLYVWGAGTHTLHLLVASRLAACNVVAFVDSNPHYEGAELAGRPVILPSSLDRPEVPILVSSAVSQEGIAQAARARYGTDVQLILLYPTRS